MLNDSITIDVDGRELKITGENTVHYAGQVWVIECSTVYRSRGPNGETGYELAIIGWLKGAPMPEGIDDGDRMAQGMPDETAQGESGTGDVSIQA